MSINPELLLETKVKGHFLFYFSRVINASENIKTKRNKTKRKCLTFRFNQHFACRNTLNTNEREHQTSRVKFEKKKL